MGKQFNSIQAMAFGARKTTLGRKAKTKAHLRLFGNRVKVQVISTIILDVACTLRTWITGRCMLLQSNHLSLQKAVAR